jgi:hypothetical protein
MTKAAMPDDTVAYQVRRYGTRQQIMRVAWAIMTNRKSPIRRQIFEDDQSGT